MKRWKFALISIAVLFGIFLIVSAFKVLTIDSRQPTPHPSKAVIDEEQAVAHLSKAITYQTVSYQDRSKIDYIQFEQFIAFLEESFPNVHGKLQFEKVNSYGLVYKWSGSDSSKLPIGLTSHYDVVPVLSGTESNWKQPPFSGKVENGLIWGRGSLDDKIGVICILEAVDYLLEEDFKPTRDTYFMFGFDEEIGGEEGASKIVENLKQKGVRFEFVLDEGGAIVENMVPGVEAPVGVVGVSEKGFATAKLSIEGSGGHSSQPKNHTNIGRLASAISKLEDAQFTGELKGPGNDLFEFIAPEMNLGMKYVFANKWAFKPVIEKILLQQPATAALIRTTIAPTIFQAGEQANALPEQAEATINLRLMPGDSLAYVKKFIEETIDDEDITVTVEGLEASKVSSVDSWQFRTIQQAARNVFDGAVVAPYLMFAGSDARQYDPISKNTYRFLPIKITSEDLNRMHGTNEHVSIENYLNAIKFYTEVIKESNK